MCKIHGFQTDCRWTFCSAAAHTKPSSVRGKHRTRLGWASIAYYTHTYTYIYMAIYLSTWAGWAIGPVVFHQLCSLSTTTTTISTVHSSCRFLSTYRIRHYRKIKRRKKGGEGKKTNSKTREKERVNHHNNISLRWMGKHEGKWILPKVK